VLVDGAWNFRPAGAYGSFVIWLLAMALAQEPAELSTVGDSIEESIRIRRQGDLEGARSLLVALEPRVDDAQRGWYLYQRGICEELLWRPAEAEALYRLVLEGGGDTVVDARFRLALVLEDQGRGTEALEQVLELARARGFEEGDEVTIDLQRGSVEIATGRTRRGVRHIQDALARVEGGDTHRYMRAKGRYMLAKALLDTADARDMGSREQQGVRVLKSRTTEMMAAESQIIALIALEEPEWILASLLRYGDSYLRLADDLAAAPAPRRLNAAQASIYLGAMGVRADKVRAKARYAYDQGIQLAIRLGFESPKVAELNARLDRMGR